MARSEHNILPTLGWTELVASDSVIWHGMCDVVTAVEVMAHSWPLATRAAGRADTLQ